MAHGIFCTCKRCMKPKPLFGNKSQQSRQKSAQRAQQKKRSDRTSPHNDGLKSSRNPKRG